MNDFHYAQFLANMLFGVDISEDLFEELGLIAWNFIGNKRCKLYRYKAAIDRNTLTVELPCNCDIIEAVTYLHEDFNQVSNISNNGDVASQYNEHYAEARKSTTNPLYISGKFVKYERVGNTLYFDKPYGTVQILYKGEVLDENGLPMINDKEALAIATYVAYVLKYKEGLTTMNGNVIQAAQLLKQEWNDRVTQARVPEYISQNDMNEILDAHTSWNRKVYGKSLKPII